MFSYKYIVANMLNNGFEAHDWSNDTAGVINGTTAYAASWSVPASLNYTLTLVISGANEQIEIGNGAFNTGNWVGGTNTYYPTPPLAPL